MASILDRYGIKEVADVTFYALDDNGKPKNPVLYLDTLKVSTIEQTGEEAEARGGKGNGLLILWDYGKEINVSLEDALFSAKSMAIMFGGGNHYDFSSSSIMKTEYFVPTSSQAATSTAQTAIQAAAVSASWDTTYDAPNGRGYNKVNAKFYKEDGTSVGTEGFEKDKRYMCTYDVTASGTIIEISANTFPGVYYVTGDTYARSEASGKDEFFQFIIPKAKVQSENTITLEAEGDPSVFNMNLRVLRPSDGVMMKLVKYDLDGKGAEPESTGHDLIHNHALIGDVTTRTNA